LKFFLDNWMLVLIALTSGGLLLWPMIQGGRGGGVSPGEAVRLINRERGVLVDVGEPAEFAAGHAAGARNVPVAALDAGKGLPTNKSLPLLVICPTGARAARAVAVLRKAGYEKAVAVAGGTAAWRDASLPIEKG
jgi:rhodanese-related sulfurtransferase